MQCDANGLPFHKCTGDRSVELLISPSIRSQSDQFSLFAVENHWSEWIAWKLEQTQRTLNIEEGRTGRTCRLRTCREGIRCDDAVDTFLLSLALFHRKCFLCFHFSHTAHDTSFEVNRKQAIAKFQYVLQTTTRFAIHLVWRVFFFVVERILRCTIVARWASREAFARPFRASSRFETARNDSKTISNN